MRFLNKEGAERRQARMSSLRATSTHRFCETGFALRRSTAAFEIPGAPLPLTDGGFRQRRKDVRDIDPRPHNGPGGCPPGTPGKMIASHPRGRRSPFTLSSPRERPSANGDETEIIL